MRLRSRISGDAIGVCFWSIEKILGAKINLPPHFWKKGATLDVEVKVWIRRLMMILGTVRRNYNDEILAIVVDRLSKADCERAIEFVKYNKVGQLIAGLNIRCGQELERQERLAAPKDEGDPEPLPTFDPGQDLRTKKNTVKTLSTWELLNGAQERRY